MATVTATSTVTIEIELGEEAARAYADANEAVRTLAKEAARASLERAIVARAAAISKLSGDRSHQIAMEAYEESKAAGVTAEERIAATRELGFDIDGNAVP